MFASKKIRFPLVALFLLMFYVSGLFCGLAYHWSQADKMRARNEQIRLEMEQAYLRALRVRDDYEQHGLEQAYIQSFVRLQKNATEPERVQFEQRYLPEIKRTLRVKEDDGLKVRQIWLQTIEQIKSAAKVDDANFSDSQRVE
jgi:hypothetical protein